MFNLIISWVFTIFTFCFFACLISAAFLPDLYNAIIYRIRGLHYRQSYSKYRSDVNDIKNSSNFYYEKYVDYDDDDFEDYEEFDEDGFHIYIGNNDEHHLKNLESELKATELDIKYWEEELKELEEDRDEILEEIYAIDKGNRALGTKGYFWDSGGI